MFSLTGDLQVQVSICNAINKWIRTMLFWPVLNAWFQVWKLIDRFASKQYLHCLCWGLCFWIAIAFHREELLLYKNKKLTKTARIPHWKLCKFMSSLLVNLSLGWLWVGHHITDNCSHWKFQFWAVDCKSYHSTACKDDHLVVQ